MKNSKMIVLALIVVGSSLLMAGCAVGVRGPDGGEVYVNSEPPPAVVEVEPPVPGPDYVWIGGEWGWDGGRWAWRQGRWDRPPRAGARWEAGRYDMRGGRRVYHRGGWR